MPAADPVTTFVEPRSTPVPRAETKRRLAAFQETLRVAGIDAALVVQNADLYYLAGTVQQSQLLVPADGEPVLFTRKTVARAREESSLPVETLPSLRRLGELVVERCGEVPAVVGLELDVLPVAQFRHYESQLPGARFVDVGPALVPRGRSNHRGRWRASPPRRRWPTQSLRASPTCCARALPRRPSPAWSKPKRGRSVTRA